MATTEYNQPRGRWIVKLERLKVVEEAVQKTRIMNGVQENSGTMYEVVVKYPEPRENDSARGWKDPTEDQMTDSAPGVDIKTEPCDQKPEIDSLQLGKEDNTYQIDLSFSIQSNQDVA